LPRSAAETGQSPAPVQPVTTRFYFYKAIAC
jgi:hypothetical protein